MAATLDQQIGNLVDDIHEPVRRDLQQALRTFREAGDVPATLVNVARLLEGEGGLLEKVGHASGVVLGGRTLESQINELAGRKVIPPLIASNLHWIRVHANKGRHRDETVALTRDDAETSLNRVLRVVRWFYCEYEKGPRLPEIAPPDPRRGRWVWWAVAASVVCVALAVGGYYGLSALNAGPPGGKGPPVVQVPPVKDKDAVVPADGPAAQTPATDKAGNGPDSGTTVPANGPGHDAQPPPSVKKTVLDNRGGATLILKDLKPGDNPFTTAADPANQVGVAPVGTEVRRVEGVEEIPVPGFPLSFVKIEVLEGTLKGKMGWVSINAIRLVDAK